MNRFIIMNDLPYLFYDEKAFSVKWDEKGFTVGEEVKLTSPPSVVMNESSILAQCAGNLDSISHVTKTGGRKKKASEE